MNRPKLYPVERPKIPARRGEVTFPVSYTYNGGTIINEEWFDGFDVPEPQVPHGFVLESIGVGLQMNSRPPIATMFLEKTWPEH